MPLSPALRRACLAARVTCHLAVVVIPVAALYTIATRGLDPALALIGIAVLVPPVTVGLWGLAALARFFEAARRGGVLTASATRDLRRFALSLLVQAVLTPIVGAAFSVLDSWANGPGQRTLAIAISSDVIGFAVLAALLLVVASALAEAAAQAEERKLII
ncbi:DUF2975 domain-containing protein [Pontivivens ytuae]|uniref:DUF2975 domain-containing protein n=1 Tax=Pontivivens ytuae TaxID=2789856 RepID=A0A7S9LUR4_9RHOB|nr:DUF2975 domain-containing protein [Pontivivens ytuae]QPH55110.1 DUF2975 domain-containing protein [Pontivivens ytuae]